ncbi:hypothetical protein FJT64_003162 [Amphibalanus amphitrite]|uniref:Uncharacterized protein n=1 Tax=Amphibalanus amphitrite TaxID=1232801 RepID=A0A6A4WC55_AMPAM|nr:hypothetical protein FJT64_003162 [Amphibalanus amphitrite]
MAKLRRSIRGSRRPKGYNHHECDCPERTGLKELLGFLPIAVVLGYTITVSASAAAGGTTSGGGSTTSVTVSGGNTVTSTNTNTPSLTNTDNDVITVSAQANPLNTLTNTASNQDNDIITNTARHLGAAADFSTPPTLWSLLVSPRVAHKRTSGKVRLPSRTASSPLPEIQEALQERVATTGELISGRPVPRSLPAVPGRAVSGTTRRPPDREADHGWRRPDLGHPSRPQRDHRPMYRQLPVR